MKIIRKMLILRITLGLALLGVICYFAIPWAYTKLDEGYQKNADIIRKKDAQGISDLIFEYEAKTGLLPFEQQTKGDNFMVIIGRSEAEEDFFANQDVLKRGGIFANSSTLESELAIGLGRKVTLPRDPQKVATYAPNVYVYFYTPEPNKQFSVAVHLFESSDESVEYSWGTTKFYSHTLTYSKKK